MKHPDSDYLKRCKELGIQSGKKGNPPVGALIVRDDIIIAEAEEAGKSKNDITCHAELEAIRVAVTSLKTNDLSDCVMYTTHEPCIMCSYAIRFHKISKIVFQNYVPFLGGISSSLPLLTTTFVPDNWSNPPEIIYLPEDK